MNAVTVNRRIRWNLFGTDRGNGVRIEGDPMRLLRAYEQTHWRMTDLVLLYQLPRHKLRFLLPPPDVVLPCCRSTNLWRRETVLAVLGQPS
jgi:hypothetical protein